MHLLFIPLQSLDSYYVWYNNSPAFIPNYNIQQQVTTSKNTQQKIKSKLLGYVNWMHGTVVDSLSLKIKHQKGCAVI